MNNPVDFMRRLTQFRQSAGNINPDAMIQQMMQSGRLSQAQYDQARQAAEQIQRMINPGAQGSS